jgi:hypothetical protein
MHSCADIQSSCTLVADPPLQGSNNFIITNILCTRRRKRHTVTNKKSHSRGIHIQISKVLPLMFCDKVANELII